MTEQTQEDLLASIKAIKEAIRADGTTTSNLLLLAGKVSTVLSAISLGVTVLQKLGVLEEKMIKF